MTTPESEGSKTKPGSGPGRIRRFAANIAVSLVATLVALVILDLALIATGLFPPKTENGDAEAGWLAATGTGSFTEERCFDPASRQPGSFKRNEDGFRTRFSAAVLRSDTALFRVAVSGDSHTELCTPNESTHFGVTESVLTDRGRPAAVFARGAGKYSALQAYLSVREAMSTYRADAFILDFYTGNDFYDMMRVDDRPSLAMRDGKYAIVPPVWYQLDAPGVVRRSRVLYAMGRLAQATGIRGVWMRVNYLRDIAVQQGEGLGAVLGYMNDIRRSAAPDVGYPLAFSAQMLNQQLFFKRFGGSREESLRRIRALLELVRREQPGRLLVLSAIPSYQLVHRDSVAPVFTDVLSRIGLTNAQGIEVEESLIAELRRAATESGWLFVDNLAALRAFDGADPLYNDYDFHITPAASRIIGIQQAAAILSAQSPR